MCRARRPVPIFLFKSTGGAPIQLHGHDGSVNALAFSSDSRRLASLGGNHRTDFDDGKALVWNMPEADGQPTPFLNPGTGVENWLDPEDKNNWGTSATFSPDGKTLCFGMGTGELRAFDVATGDQLPWDLFLPGGVITALGFRGEHRLLVSQWFRVTLWDLKYRNELLELSAGSIQLSGGRSSRDGSKILMGGRGGYLASYGGQPDADLFAQRMLVRRANLAVMKQLDARTSVDEVRRWLKNQKEFSGPTVTEMKAVLDGIK